MAAPQINKTTTIEEFEALAEATYQTIVQVGLSTADKSKVRSDLLGRFAQQQGMSVADAEDLLRRNSGATAAAPSASSTPLVAQTPEEEEQKQQALQQLAEAMRERATAADGPYFWEKPESVAFIEMFIALRRDAGLVANLLITGPSGTGKTEGIMRAGNRAGIPVYKVDCASVTTADKWLGHKEFEDGATKYVLSEHLKWVEAKDCEPGIVLYDEITRLHPTLHNTLLPILDGSQSVWVPELGIHIKVHPDTIFIATANIGVNYTGTHKLDGAMAGRFGYRMERDYPPQAEEEIILAKRTGVNATQAKTLVEIANLTRQRMRTGELDDAISTRNLLDCAALVAAGMPIMQATEFTFVTTFSEDGGAASQRTAVRQIITGKAGAR